VAISASEARARLFPLIQQVNDDHLPVRTNSKGGDAVLMSAEDFDSWQETIYLSRSFANARRLMEAVERDKSGRGASPRLRPELTESSRMGSDRDRFVGSVLRKVPIGVGFVARPGADYRACIM